VSDAVLLNRRLTETAYNFPNRKKRPDEMNRRNLSAQKLQSALAEVRQVYVDLAQRPIERNCVRQTECCHFKLTGRTPYLTKGEAIVAARALRATGRKSLPENTDGSCPMLQRETGNCLIYEDRPFGCRTHFCAAAGGPIARREVLDFIRRLEDVDLALNGNGSRTLPNAVAEALEEI
jgi:Fe-S-cluster containining protein